MEDGCRMINPVGKKKKQSSDDSRKARIKKKIHIASLCIVEKLANENKLLGDDLRLQPIRISVRGKESFKL